jgi:hypothetical protein
VTLPLSRSPVRATLDLSLEIVSLIAYHIEQRWFRFENMGPTPSGRSGHAMSSMGTKVFVLGGESFVPFKQDDSDIVYVLDTSQ